MVRLVALIAALAAVPDGGARPMGDAALLPADGAEWKKVEGPKVFTSDDLYGHIDGGAELFLELGFEQLTVQLYRAGERELSVEVYRMTDTAAATGIYLMSRGKETRAPGFKERHTLNRYQLMFVRERYYVTINNQSDDELGPELLRFGTQLAARLPADRMPAELSWLPAAGLKPGSERIIWGPVGLQSLFALGEGDILQLRPKTVGVAGGYGDTTVIVVKYADASAAKKALENVKQRLDPYLKPVRSTATEVVFKDLEEKYGQVQLVKTNQLAVTLHLDRPAP